MKPKASKLVKANELLNTMEAGTWLDCIHEDGDPCALVKDAAGLLAYAVEGGWDSLVDLARDIAMDVNELKRELIGKPFIIYGSDDTRCWVFNETDKIAVLTDNESVFDVEDEDE